MTSVTAATLPATDAARAGPWPGPVADFELPGESIDEAAPYAGAEAHPSRGAPDPEPAEGVQPLAPLLALVPVHVAPALAPGTGAAAVAPPGGGGGASAALDAPSPSHLPVTAERATAGLAAATLEARPQPAARNDTGSVTMQASVGRAVPDTSGSSSAAEASPPASTAMPGRPMAQQALAPVPILVETLHADRQRPAAAVRTGRGPIELASAAMPGESPSPTRVVDGAMAPPTVVAPADVRSQAPQSGPERMEPAPAERPGLPSPDAQPDDPGPTGQPTSGHVQSARLALGMADRLSVTLGAANEASRLFLESETGQLASDLATAGAKVEAIRVDLVTRVNPDGRADAASGQHPGPEQGGGAPGDRGAQPDRAAARAPDAKDQPRSPRQSGPGVSDGGKVDRYA